MEWYEPRNYGQEKCGDDEVSEQRLEAEEEALLLQETVEGVRRQLLRLGHAVPRGKGLLECVVVAGGGEGVGQRQLLGEAGQGALLQVVQRVRVERYAHDGCEGRTYGDDKERVGKHELGIDLLYDEDTKGDDENHHSQTAEEHREVKHLVGARGGDAKRAGYLEHTARVGAVEHGGWDEDKEEGQCAQPLGDPRAEGEIEIHHTHGLSL